MKISREQCDELVEKLAAELVQDQMEKTAGIKDIGKGVKDVYTGKSVRRAEEAVKWGKKDLEEAPDDPEVIEQLQKAQKRVGREQMKQTGALLGTGAAGTAGMIYGGKKIHDRAKEAAEALIEAVLTKQAANDDAFGAGLYAEASEKALNSLGYSMFAEEE